MPAPFGAPPKSQIFAETQMADVDPQKKVMGMCLLVTQDALTRCLGQPSKTKGDQRSEWLLEFENELVRDAKDIVTEGVPMNDELVLVESAIKYLKFIFDGARREIAEKSKDE